MTCNVCVLSLFVFPWFTLIFSLLACSHRFSGRSVAAQWFSNNDTAAVRENKRLWYVDVLIKLDPTLFYDQPAF